MCKAVEELVEDLITDEKKNIALRFLEKGIASIEEIAECADLPIEVVEKLALSKGKSK